MKSKRKTKQAKRRAEKRQAKRQAEAEALSPGERLLARIRSERRERHGRAASRP